MARFIVSEVKLQGVKNDETGVTETLSCWVVVDKKSGKVVGDAYFSQEDALKAAKELEKEYKRNDPKPK